jgi:hypothetical protein
MIVSLIVMLILGIFFFTSGRALLLSAFVLLAFGTLAAIPPEFIGGTTVLGSSLAFMLVVVRQFIVPKQPQRVLTALLDYRGLLLLTLFALVAIIGAFTLPRAFDERVMVYPMRGGEFSFTAPLQPTSSNFNQALNQMVDLGVAASIYAMTRISGFMDRVRQILIAGGIAIIVTGLADMVLSNIGLSAVLEVFRTASYKMMDEAEIAGVRRVIGMMSEPSSYGALATTFGALLLFCRNAFEPKTRFRLAYPLAIGCILFAVLSTSSTAYGAMAVLGALHVADIAWRLIFSAPNMRKDLYIELTASIFAAAAALLVFLSWDAGREMAMRMLDSIIFKKSQGDSYIERSAWTRQGFEAFKATYGIGVGVGSVRTSNFFVNILASTGVLGSLLFAAFLLRVFLARIPSRMREHFEFVHGAKLTIVVMFVSLFLAGTTPDYGLLMAALFGGIAGLATRPRQVKDASIVEEPPEMNAIRRPKVERL